MTHALFLAPLNSPKVGEEVVVSGDEGRHAVSVRRIHAGESVFVADGHGTAIQGEVTSAEKSVLRVRIDEVFVEEPAAVEIVAVQALTKHPRDEQAVEAMTELGVDGIVPWRASRSIVKWDPGPRGVRQLDKWRSTAREASKQSRRFRVPEVTGSVSTGELCGLVAASDAAFILHEEATEMLATSELPTSGRILLVIGPEGGISPEELTALTGAGGRPVLVARHVLRASTAGVVAVAQLQALAESQAREGHTGG